MENLLKIIQITPSYKPAYIYGGPIQSVAKLCETLSKISKEPGGLDYIDLKVLTSTANGNTELTVTPSKPTLLDGVSITYFKRLTKDHSHFSPQLLRSLWNQIRDCSQNEKPIIHIHAWWNLISILSCWVAKCYNVPVILSPRGMLTSYTQNNRSAFSKKVIHNLIGKKLLKYCHIHATSRQEEQDILKIIIPKSIVVIPNLVNIKESFISPRSVVDHKSHNIFRLIFLSRIEEKKGLELLFNTLESLDINWFLTIAGMGDEGYIKSLKVKAKALKIDNQLSWIGHVTDSYKYDLMAQHDLLVLPSYNENFANVVIESLSVGTPVLISDKVGLSDYVMAKQLGWISTLDVANIQENLLKAFSDLEKRKTINQSAPGIIRRDFNNQVLANEYLQFYKTLR